MGKNLNSGDLVQRAEKLAFYGVPAQSASAITYLRMEGFTNLSTSKNPSEYSRRYVDETSDRVSTSGFDLLRRLLTRLTVTRGRGFLTILSPFARVRKLAVRLPTEPSFRWT